MDEPRIPFDVVRILVWVLTEVSCGRRYAISMTCGRAEY